MRRLLIRYGAQFNLRLEAAMDVKLERRINQLEARVEAMTQLLLSHIVACDIVTEGSAQDTIHMVESQRQSLREKCPLAELLLDDMIEDIRSVCELPSR